MPRSPTTLQPAPPTAPEPTPAPAPAPSPWSVAGSGPGSGPATRCRLVALSASPSLGTGDVQEGASLLVAAAGRPGSSESTTQTESTVTSCPAPTAALGWGVASHTTCQETVHKHTQPGAPYRSTCHCNNKCPTRLGLGASGQRKGNVHQGVRPAQPTAVTLLVLHHHRVPHRKPDSCKALRCWKQGHPVTTGAITHRRSRTMAQSCPVRSSTCIQQRTSVGRSHTSWRLLARG